MSAPAPPPAATSTAGPAPVRRARPDASMTLLVEVLERPLDPGYAAAAARRRAATGSPDGGAAPRSRRRGAVTAALAAATGLLVTGAVLALHTPSNPSDRSELVADIQRRTSEADALAVSASQLRAEVQSEQDALLEGDPGAPSASDGVLVASGTTEVTGPGLVVTLTDGRAATADPANPRDVDPAADARVQDGDLQRVANGLWASGAEAVAINGQRLTAATAIRSAGGAVLVNFRPLSPPYRVEAIGSPNALAASFALTPAARWLQALQDQYGIGVQVSTEEALDLPALDAQRLYSARVPGAASASASAVPSSTPSSTSPSARPEQQESSP